MPHQLVEGSEFPGLKYQGGKGGFETLIVGAQDGGDGAPSDPVSRAFVGDGESPASGACSVPGGIASVNDGAGAGDRDHTGARAESGFQGNDSIAHDFDVGQGEIHKNLANLHGNLRSRGAGSANTGGTDLVGRNPRRRAHLLNRATQNIPGLGFAKANDIATAGYYPC